MADIVLVDTGAGIADSVLEFVMACPEVLLVSTPEPSSLTDSYSLLKALHRNPNFAKSGTQIHVVANHLKTVTQRYLIYHILPVHLPQNLHGWQPHESAFRFWQNSDSGAVPLTDR